MKKNNPFIYNFINGFASSFSEYQSEILNSMSKIYNTTKNCTGITYEKIKNYFATPHNMSTPYTNYPPLENDEDLTYDLKSLNKPENQPLLTLPNKDCFLFMITTLFPQLEMHVLIGKLIISFKKTYENYKNNKKDFAFHLGKSVGLSLNGIVKLSFPNIKK